MNDQTCRASGLALHGTTTVDDFALTIDLDVAAGQCVALVGPNGAGKSTVVRLLCGLLALDTGRLALDDAVLDDTNASAFVAPEHRRFGIVFQDRRLFPHLDVGENIAFGLRARGVRRPEARRRATATAERLDLVDLLDRRPGTLSGGQQQRVAVARALADDPRVLVLDEPLTALDASSYRTVRSVLHDVIRSAQIPVVMITHDPVDAMTLADHIVVLDGGRVVQAGDPTSIRRHPRSRWVADLLGVNLFHGMRRGDRVVIDDEHVVVVAPGSPSASSRSGGDGPVDVVVHPRSVSVHRDAPLGSARNVWPAVVAEVSTDSDRVRVVTEGPVVVVAEITEAARSDLGIVVGAKVWVSFKATDVAVHA